MDTPDPMAPMDRMTRMDRRFFLRLSALAAAAGLARWTLPPAARAMAGQARNGEYDAAVVGAGLGGLCCAAYLARHGFRVVVLEQTALPGGYANCFRRPGPGGDFTCEISLHASVLGSPDMRAMLDELGVWDRLTPAPHPHAWSSRFPDFALDVPARCGLAGFERQLAGLFPAEAAGLAAYFALWRGVMEELARLERGMPEHVEFPKAFPRLWTIHDATIGRLIDAHVRDPRCRAVLGQSCGYYGLPPSQLAAFYYLIPTAEYLEYGGDYLKGSSRTLSEALARAVTEAGGEIRYGRRVQTVLVEQGRAVGVRTADGTEVRARAVVCNAAARALFDHMLPAGTLPAPDAARLAAYTDSPSSVIVWLGLDRDITAQHPAPEVSYFTGTDLEAGFRAAMAGDFERGGCSVMIYDDLVPGFSPPGCSTITIMSLCGWAPWQPFAADYLAGRKDAYRAEKQRLTDRLIRMAEARAIPGLSGMIAMRESSTPLTNLRFTGNPS
ncbi:MAG: phytoene desaturase family protein, partial [Desulfovibrionaceae bacterium]